MSRISITSGLFAAFALTTIVSACGLRVSSVAQGADSGPGSETACAPGEVASCTCASGQIGQQQCNQGGSGYGACGCTGPAPSPGPNPVPPPSPSPGPVPNPTPVPTPSPTPTWPPPPPNPAPPVGTSMTFAVRVVHLGDETGSGTLPDWASYGYDLDGKVTTAASTDVCTLANNANRKNQTDGVGGIDNSFGENIVPLIGAVSANPSASADKAFAAGTFGWILSIRGLSADPVQSAIGLTGEFFLGAPFGQFPNSPTSIPSFSLGDDWPVDRSMVVSPVGANGLVASPAVSVSEFPKAYVVSGEFVSGISQPLELVLPLGGVSVRLPVRHAIITFQRDIATHAAGGIIAGVIATEDLVAAIQLVAGDISTSLCATGAFAQIKTSIEQASDILIDGTNTPGVPCNAISIGIGFEADEIHDPQYAVTVPPPNNPCGDGG